MVATSPRVSPTHSPMSKPVSSIRYRCGFPGCNKRYASTDGTPAHTARESWPQRRQTHTPAGRLCLPPADGRRGLASGESSDAAARPSPRLPEPAAPA